MVGLDGIIAMPLKTDIMFDYIGYAFIDEIDEAWILRGGKGEPFDSFYCEVMVQAQRDGHIRGSKLYLLLTNNLQISRSFSIFYGSDAHDLPVITDPQALIDYVALSMSGKRANNLEVDVKYQNPIELFKKQKMASLDVNK